MDEAVADQRNADGLYGPRSVAWTVNREAVLLLASGPRALLFQLAHPLIAEGVDQHSDFRRDPWTRLERTTRSYFRIVYGTTHAARAEIRHLNAFHRGIRGPISDLAAQGRFGDRYEARDPELQLWVHATLIESVAAAYETWIRPLTPDERARYYDETRVLGRAFGIADGLLPRDTDAFETYFASMRAPDGPVHPSPLARDLAGYVLRPRLDALIPALGWLPPATYSWLQWPSLELLPADLRAEYGIPWGPMQSGVAAWLREGMLAWRPIVPPRVRWFPRAVRAFRRAGVDVR